MSKTVTLRLDDATYKLFREWAEADNRSLSNMIETAAKRWVESRYMDPKEEAGIMADKELVKSLRRGSRDAKARRGRWVV
jgi:hypothetical protein